jgi:hypothetical protein
LQAIDGASVFKAALPCVGHQFGATENLGETRLPLSSHHEIPLGLSSSLSPTRAPPLKMILSASVWASLSGFHGCVRQAGLELLKMDCRHYPGPGISSAEMELRPPAAAISTEPFRDERKER